MVLSKSPKLYLYLLRQNEKEKKTSPVTQKYTANHRAGSIAVLNWLTRLFVSASTMPDVLLPAHDLQCHCCLLSVETAVWQMSYRSSPLVISGMCSRGEELMGDDLLRYLVVYAPYHRPSPRNLYINTCLKVKCRQTEGDDRKSQPFC